MTALRVLTHRYRGLALALIVLALAMKAVVPSGFMVRSEGRSVTIAVCDGHGDAAQVKIEIPGQPAGGSFDKAGPACAFTALAFGALGGADVALLAALLLFIVAFGFRPAATPAPRRAAHLRPPLRGPPVAC